MEGLPQPVSPLHQMTLRFDGSDPDQARRASLVRALDAFEQVELLDVRKGGPQRIELTVPGNHVLTGYPLFRHLARSLRLLWPAALLTFVPGAGMLGRRWYPEASVEGGKPHSAE
jgi:hypothetical protein